MFFYLIRSDLTHRIKAIQPRVLILNMPYGFLAVFNFRSCFFIRLTVCKHARQ